MPPFCQTLRLSPTIYHVFLSIGEIGVTEAKMLDDRDMFVLITSSIQMLLLLLLLLLLL